MKKRRRVYFCCHCQCHVICHQPGRNFLKSAEFCIIHFVYIFSYIVLLEINANIVIDDTCLRLFNYKTVIKQIIEEKCKSLRNIPSEQMPELTVTSEIYQEYDYKTKITPSKEGNVISEFPFLLCLKETKKKFDKDSDLDIERPQKEVIKIEHSFKTKIALVGLQVWRGAFLLGDLLIYLGLKGELEGKHVLEVGAGTGLTSFVAALYAKKVVCTDIDLGGILELIKLNAKYNAKLLKSQFKVMPLDFSDTNWDPDLAKEIKETDFIIAADVIYDDDVTSAFVRCTQKILNTNPPKTMYIVLEKRYVFTIDHMDSVAPCYETFLSLLDKVKTDNSHSEWAVEQLPLDFPKYFTYDRVKELVLWKITSKPK